MAPSIEFLPLAGGVLLLALPFIAGYSARVRNPLTRLALFVFGGFVARPSSRKRRREGIIRAAHMDTMYRVYASRTLMYTTIVALGGALIGLYAIVIGIEVLALPEATLRNALPGQLGFLAEGLQVPTLSSFQLFLLFLVSSATFGSVFGAIAYFYRWIRPRRRADRRERRIEESLPRTVAFMFALSRSGMAHEELIRILSRNSKYFGEAAEEFIISLRDIEVSSRDFLTATRDLARTTPSSEFANFAEDLANVLRTGRSMSEYFREEYEKYQNDKQTRQEQVLEQIAALAEGYVALLVAGPLFLITILVVIGLLIGGTLTPLRMLVYLVLPVMNVAFLVYLGDLTASLGIDVNVEDHSIETRDIVAEDAESDDSPAGTAAVADGGLHDPHLENRARLHLHNQIRTLRHRLADPVRAVARSPDTVLYVVIPIATVYVLLRLYLDYAGGGITARSVDGYLVQATLFAAGTFAIGEYLHSNRENRIEEAMPDFIDRLADQTEAGMTLTRAIKGMDPTSVPGFERQIRELQSDIRLGARTTDALRRMAATAQSVLVSRAVILMTNALRASGDLAPVLRISADEAQLDRRLARRRRQELFIYQIIIYVSMLVFIGITVTLVVIFIPSLPKNVGLGGVPSAPSAPGGPGVGGLSGIGGGSTGGNRAAYSLVLFHSAMVQSVLAGFVAGKMGEGRIRAGAKHATLLLAIVYVVTLLV